jgi:hypothetical protein
MPTCSRCCRGRAGDDGRVSNYTKPERPEGVPSWAYVGAEYINGTGQVLMWMDDDQCANAGGEVECCTGDLRCGVKYMPWQQMQALAMWMLGQVEVARSVQLREQG